MGYNMDTDKEFMEAMEQVLSFEGGYANDPTDRGGETFRGISRKNWPNWDGWRYIDYAKKSGKTSAKFINNFFSEGSYSVLMRDSVYSFYYTNFWKPFDRLSLPKRFQAKVFDTSVNIGIKPVMKFIQRVINSLSEAKLSVDGIVGPKTIEAASVIRKKEQEALDLFCKYQADYYNDIVSRRPSQSKYIKGWLRRAKWQPGK